MIKARGDFLLERCRERIERYRALVVFPGAAGSRLVLYWQVGWAVRKRRKLAQAVGVKKRLRLLDDLLMLFVAGAELPQPGVIAVLYRIPAGLCIPAGDAGAQQQRRLQNSEPGGYAMYLLAVVCRYQAAPAGLTPPDSFCSLLLVVGQPLNPLPPSGAVVVLVCLLQRIRVLLAVLVLRK